MSEEKIISFNRKRSEISGDCRLWNVTEALKETLREIEAGEIDPESMCMVMWLKKTDDGVEFFQRFAGVTSETACAMLSLAHFNVLKCWN